MKSIANQQQARYTVADYLNWPGDERWELIAGEVYNMSPAPTVKHQSIVGDFYNQLKQQLKGKSCVPYVAPLDVVLSDNDVVQPDVLVVCDPAKITEKNIQGAPDLVVEVLSPSTALKDMREKKALYERFGVREYVVIDPLEEYVQRFCLQNDGHYCSCEIFGPHEVLPLLSLPEIEIQLWKIFDVNSTETEAGLTE